MPVTCTVYSDRPRLLDRPHLLFLVLRSAGWSRIWQETGRRFRLRFHRPRRSESNLQRQMEEAATLPEGNAISLL